MVQNLPRKWLRYLGYAITGKHGTLSLLTPVDPQFDEDSPVNPDDHYVFTYEGEAAIVHPDLYFGRLLSSQTTSFCASTIQPELLDAIATYYGGCPFTRFPVGSSEVSYLVPGKRGDAGINYLYQSRGGYRRDCTTVDINDPSNAILLDLTIHRAFDRGDLSFLKTPNNYLRSDEVPHGEVQPDRNAEEYCLTSQYLEGSPEERGFHHGLATSLPDDTRRPPDFIFDVLYGCSAFKCWGVENELYKDLRVLLVDEAKEQRDRHRQEREERQYTDNDTDEDSELDTDEEFDPDTEPLAYFFGTREPDAMSFLQYLSLLNNGITLERLVERIKAGREEERQRITTWVEQTARAV